MRNVLDYRRENQNAHFMLNNFFFFEDCADYENVKKYGGTREATNGNTVWRKRVACCISKATRTRARVILIAFPRQLWLRRRASITLYVIACLVSLLETTKFRRYSNL